MDDCRTVVPPQLVCRLPLQSFVEVNTFPRKPHGGAEGVTHLSSNRELPPARSWLR